MIGMLRSGQKQDIETGAALGRSGFCATGRAADIPAERT